MEKDNLLQNVLTGHFTLVIFAAALTIVCLIPAGAAESGISRAVITPVEINITNTTPLDPAALPAEFRITRKPVEVKVELKETMLPAPKGEMAAGPRLIGIAFDPVVTAAAIVIVIVGIIGWYFLRRRNDPEDKE